MSYISHISNVTRQFSEAVHTAIQTNWQDFGMKKIIERSLPLALSASLFACTGMYLLKAKSWMNVSSTNQEPSTKKVLRYGMFTIGFIALCYSAYMIASQIMEFWTPPTFSFPFCGAEATFVEEFTEDMCPIHLAQAKETFLSCPEAKNLWDYLQAEKTFSVRCVPSSEVAFRATINPTFREIMITDHKEMVRNLLFELNNLKQAKRIKQFIDIMCDFPPDTFALNIEGIEFASNENTIRIANQCLSYGWSQEIAFPPWYAKASMTFQQHLNTYAPHTDMIHIKWYEICAPEQLCTKLVEMTQKYTDELKKLKNMQDQISKLVNLNWQEINLPEQLSQQMAQMNQLYEQWKAAQAQIESVLATLSKKMSDHSPVT